MAQGFVRGGNHEADLDILNQILNIGLIAHWVFNHFAQRNFFVK